jgi:hypothetical protein
LEYSLPLRNPNIIAVFISNRLLSKLMKARTVAPLFHIIVHLCGLFPESLFVAPIRATFLPNLFLLRLITLKSANFEGPRVYFFSVLFFSLCHGCNCYPQNFVLRK